MEKYLMVVDNICMPTGGFFNMTYIHKNNSIIDKYCQGDFIKNSVNNINYYVYNVNLVDLDYEVKFYDVLTPENMIDIMFYKSLGEEWTLIFYSIDDYYFIDLIYSIPENNGSLMLSYEEIEKVKIKLSVFLNKIIKVQLFQHHIIDAHGNQIVKNVTMELDNEYMWD
jgi:hypothetical protein